MTTAKKSLTTVLCLSLLLSGCRFTSYVDLSQIQKLDDWQSGEVQPIATVDGVYAFGARSWVRIRTRDGLHSQIFYTSIDVTDSEFVGNRHGEEDRYPLSEITSIQVGDTRIGEDTSYRGQVVKQVIVGVSIVVGVALFIWFVFIWTSEDHEDT